MTRARDSSTLKNMMIDMPSPNYNDRPEGMQIRSIIIHYTNMVSAEAALEWLTSEASRVSSHYVIDEDGTLYRLVQDDKRAWHAGLSKWGELENFNDFSIGIELVNPGHDHGYRPFPEAQIKALVILMRGLFERHPIDPTLVLGHSDIAPERKQDPGHLFPWDRLVQEKLAIRP